MNARRLLAVALVALFAPACGISSEDSPRDIPAAEHSQLGVNTDRSAGATGGTALVYLLAAEAPGQTQVLQAVARDVQESPTALLTELFAGPNAQEANNQVRTALPAGTTLLSASRRGGVLTVGVSKDLLALSGQVLIEAIAQIVFTGSGLAGVQSVEVFVEGARQQWPAGNSELQSRPLTAYDYPGLVQSAQPPYPAYPAAPTLGQQ